MPSGLDSFIPLGDRIKRVKGMPFTYPGTRGAQTRDPLVRCASIALIHRSSDRLLVASS